MSTAPDFDFESVSLDWLHTKPGAKWNRTPYAIAAWVADMDFAPPPVVADALQRVITTGDLSCGASGDLSRVAGLPHAGAGDDPSVSFLERGVRLSEVPNFGSEGNGFTRLNFATSSSVLREIVSRMAAS